MWKLNNNTPFAAERGWVRDKNGAEVWLVAVKGTFLIKKDGSLKLADKQDKICLAPMYRGAPNESSLLYDSDLVHTKVATDVIVNGHAYAPKGKKVRKTTVRLIVANIDKSLRVMGDRIWKGIPLLMWKSRPQPFEKMPIIYERAYGGRDLTSKNPKRHKWDLRNTVGTGFAKRKWRLLGTVAPNIEEASGLMNSEKKPVGFGPIMGHWQPRVKFAGTYNKKWEKERQPLVPLDFDERFYQCAPKDQQVNGFLKGGETVKLLNMTPDGHITFRLPRVTLGFQTDFGGNDIETHHAVIHTVIIEPDVPKVVLVWHTNLECHTKVTKLLHTTITLKKRILVSEKMLHDKVWIGEDSP